ncbi:hypothetical protein ABLO27_14670 [Roseibium sp. SCPC15]|uniref:hypothetical protein n=1 Tax=Roseibium sp. SCP15 TaxID=3141376 RepID=UPI00333BBAD8
MTSERSFHKYPKSLWFFAFTAFIFCLQYFPTVGVFLMMVGAILWSILLINLGFFGIATEAIMGRVHRIWIIFPILWFGGYFLFALNDHLTVSQLQTELGQANAAVAIPFDATFDELIFTNFNVAADLVEDYRVPVVFINNAGNGKTGTVAAQLAKMSLCDLVRFDPAFREAGIHIRLIRTKSKGDVRSTWDESRCILFLPLKSEPQGITVVESTSTQIEYGLPVEFSEMIITTIDNNQHALVYGKARPLSWWPKPIIGCALNSSNPSWDCFWEFSRDNVVLAAPPDRKYRVASDLIANVLGLELVTAETQQVVQSSDLKALMQSIVDEFRSTEQRSEFLQSTSTD